MNKPNNVSFHSTSILGKLFDLSRELGSDSLFPSFSKPDNFFCEFCFSCIGSEDQKGSNNSCTISNMKIQNDISEIHCCNTIKYRSKNENRNDHDCHNNEDKENNSIQNINEDNLEFENEIESKVPDLYGCDTLVYLNLNLNSSEKLPRSTVPAQVSVIGNMASPPVLSPIQLSCSHSIPFSSLSSSSSSSLSSSSSSSSSCSSSSLSSSSSSSSPYSCFSNTHPSRYSLIPPSLPSTRSHTFPHQTLPSTLPPAAPLSLPSFLSHLENLASTSFPFDSDLKTNNSGNYLQLATKIYTR